MSPAFLPAVAPGMSAGFWQSAAMTDLTHHLWAAATSPATATHHVATLVTYPPAQVATAAGQALERGVTDAWQRGWLPYDLVQTVSRSLTDVEVSLVVSAVAAENQT